MENMNGITVLIAENDPLQYFIAEKCPGIIIENVSDETTGNRTF